ncbi:uncharacterized protein [Nicotiana tomentosiformis]|uniref:uncharacterized protein n=1 Tax=Nicotiana tomentosiformis TaxID=4098 RepID=UPI00388C76FD
MPEDDQRRLERWWETYGRRRPVGAAPLTWQQFSFLFLEKFVPESRKEELRRQFEQLRQGEMFVTQYEMRFSELARHAVWERVFGVTFDEVVDIARQIEMVRGQERIERETKRPRGQGSFSGVPQGGLFQPDQFQQSQSSFSALPAQGSHYAPPAQMKLLRHLASMSQEAERLRIEYQKAVNE